MSKPIEAGCRAVVVDSMAGHSGNILRVLGVAGPAGLDGCDVIGEFGQRWRVDAIVPTNIGDYVNHFGEYQLKRLDDDEPGNWDDIKDIFTPKDLMVLGD